VSVWRLCGQKVRLSRFVLNKKNAAFSSVVQAAHRLALQDVVGDQKRAEDRRHGRQETPNRKGDPGGKTRRHFERQSETGKVGSDFWFVLYLKLTLL
jgi:hypothetical protein